MKSAHRGSRPPGLLGVVSLGALFFASGCARSTQCTVENLSSASLTHIVVSGTGFSAPVPDLAPGARVVVALRAPGEAGTFEIVFVAGGREYRHSEPVYFEAHGYSALVRISPEFQVTVQVGLAKVARASSSSAPSTGAS